MRRLLPVARIEGLAGDGPGLTSAQVVERRALYGTNDIVESPPSGWADLLRETVRDPMIWFLAGTSLLFAWLGDYPEAIVLAVALAPIVGMDAYLHRRTLASTEGLAGRLATTAMVLRDGKTSHEPASGLVPGDLVVVPESAPFPADGVIVAGGGLQADESALTGEAMPVRKASFAGRVAGSDEIAVEGLHWGFAGTRLLTSEAKLRVVFTGRDTLYGQIVQSARSGRHERTPLQRSIGALVAALTVCAAVLCIGLAVTRLVQGHGPVDAIVSAVTLAVAALPEEFPVVFAFFLGVGVYRLARKQALVRRAVVVENIGRVTCICSDKTGTLTEGRLRLAHVEPADGVSRDRLLHAAATASRAASGDPLDQASLSTAAFVQGTEVAVFPFTEDRRREVAVSAAPAGGLYCAAKGAPETILAMTRLAGDRRGALLQVTQNLAAQGHKIIACAERNLDRASWKGVEPEGDYVYLGLLAFEDPVREGVAEAVAQAQSAGIRVIMVTGDHPATARAIAGELGIGSTPPRVIEGHDLQVRLERDGIEGLSATDVIARAIPAQKLDLVRALQRSGEIVAVTGDGVNDVPALQGADIGIAMGERGTRTAREVASIVLLDDNFRTIVGAIAEGRQLFRNLKLSYAYLLIVHVPLVITAALVPLAGFPLLYLPAHIVWLELIIHPTALLVFQQLPPSGSLEFVDRRAGRRFFDGREWSVVGVAGAMITLMVVLGYLRGLGDGQDAEHARSMALAVLIVAGATATAGLSRLRTVSALTTIGLAVGSALVFIQVPAIADVLHVAPLHGDDLLLAFAGGLAAGAPAGLFPYVARLRFRKGMPGPG